MSTAGALIRSLRPRQWVKNVFVFAALVFGQRFIEPAAVLRSLAAFAVFCALSSAVYLINDIADREADRLHPTKRRRPIAAGLLSVRTAGIAALLLAGGAVWAAYVVSVPLASIAATYLAMNLAYSLKLKNVVILDVMIVAGGFLLRAWAGAVVLDVAMSHWLVLCTGLIALFLGFVKRRQEIASLPTSAEQRPILSEYSVPLLDHMISIVTASTLAAYSLYAFSTEVADKLGTPWMGLTLPFVIYGIFRYLYLVHRHGKGENPTGIVVSDPPLIWTMMLWGGTVLLLLYMALG